MMANSSTVYVRMDTNLKENAEDILSQLGISASSAVQMFYKQIVLHRGIPFDMKLPADKPVAIGGMSRAEFDAELQMGMNALKNGPRFSADDIDQEFAREFGA